MNRLLIALFLGLTPRFGLAADNSPAVSTNKPAVIEIVSEDGFEYDFNKGEAVYRGNVVVRDAQMIITSQILTAQFVKSATNTAARPGQPMISNQLGAKVESIVAEGGVVVISQRDKRFAKGEKAVYTTKTDTVVLTGTPGNQPSVHFGTNHFFKANRIIYDRRNGKFRGEGNTDSRFDQTGGLYNTTTKPPGLRSIP